MHNFGHPHSSSGKETSIIFAMSMCIAHNNGAIKLWPRETKTKELLKGGFQVHHSLGIITIIKFNLFSFNVYQRPGRRLSVMPRDTEGAHCTGPLALPGSRAL